MVNPTFQNSIEDVNLLFEVRHFPWITTVANIVWILWVSNQKYGFVMSLLFLAVLCRSCWLACSLETSTLCSPCRTRSWPPCGRPKSWKSSARTSCPKHSLISIAWPLTFPITWATCAWRTLSALCWPWCTPPSGWPTLPQTSKETCGQSPLSVCTELSSWTWQLRTTSQLNDIAMLGIDTAFISRSLLEKEFLSFSIIHYRYDVSAWYSWQPLSTIVSHGLKIKVSEIYFNPIAVFYMHWDKTFLWFISNFLKGLLLVLPWTNLEMQRNQCDYIHFKNQGFSLKSTNFCKIRLQFLYIVLSLNTRSTEKKQILTMYNISKQKCIHTRKSQKLI